MAGKKNPWGKPSGGDGDKGGDGPRGDADGGKPRGPRNPWLPGGGNAERPRRSANIEDIFKNRGPEGPRRSGGGGPRGPNFRIPQRPGGKSWFPVAMGAIALIWIAVTSVHFVQPREQGVVTWLGGAYSRTLSPGTEWTFPWPIQSVTIEDVSQIRIEEIDVAGGNLILTGDQNLVDLSYLVRWNISDLVQYQYELADPTDTVFARSATDPDPRATELAAVADEL